MKIFYKFKIYLNNKKIKEIIGNSIVFNNMQRLKFKNFYSKNFRNRLKQFSNKIKINEFIKNSNEATINEYILINYTEEHLLISEIIETKRLVKVLKIFEINLPNNIVSQNKVVNSKALSDILKNIFSLFVNSINKPVLLNLDSSLFMVKSFSCKDSPLITESDPKIIANSPYINENTSAIIKETIQNKLYKSAIVFYTNKEIINSWHNVLINLNKPLVGISNGFIQIVHRISLDNKIPENFIVADIGLTSCSIFFHSYLGEISSLRLPYGTDLYNSSNEDIRIEFFKRFQTSINQFLSEMGSNSVNEIFLGGKGLYLVENDIQKVSSKIRLINEKLNYKIDFIESEDSTKEQKQTQYRNQIFSLNLDNIKYNAIENSSLYKKFKFKRANKKIKNISNEIKFFTKLIVKNKIYLYPLSLILFITTLINLSTIPSIITKNKFREDHTNFKEATHKLKINNTLINENITSVVKFSSIYRNQAQVFLFSKFLQESILPNETKLVGYLINNNGFNLELISKNIDGLNKVIKLLENNPIINRNSLSIDIIRNLNSSNELNNKILLKLNGRLKNLTLKDRLEYSKKYKNNGAYIKLKPFSNINNLFK